uniref:Uncharacterized protein n=1 Tax=Tetranychus urticae TaxID=32264 RepID=T1L0N7_TETUR
MNWFLVNIIIRVIISVTFTVCVLKSITDLNYQYGLFRIAFHTSHNDSGLFEPPCISICIKVKSLINVTSLITLYPGLVKTAQRIIQDNQQFSNWSFDQLIEDVNQGENLIFGELTLSQIAKIIVPIEQLFDKCHYLDENLSNSPCEDKYFKTYFYDKSLCASFQAWPRLGIEFSRSDLRIPGYRGLILYQASLDLTQVPSVSEFSVVAHRLNKIPWSQGDSTIELKLNPSAVIYHYITFFETTTKLLPPPFESQCKIPIKPYTSVGHCLSRCFMSNFTRITGRLPHQYVINNPNNLKFLHLYEGLEKYQTLVAQLYAPCKDICGLTDCLSDAFEWRKLGHPVSSYHPKNYVNLQIYPPSRLPIIKEARPQIDWLDFFSSIGGVIGLYFGLSFFSMIDLIINFSFDNFIAKLFGHSKAKEEVNNRVQPLNVEVLDFTQTDLSSGSYFVYSR